MAVARIQDHLEYASVGISEAETEATARAVDAVMKRDRREWPAFPTSAHEFDLEELVASSMEHPALVPFHDRVLDASVVLVVDALVSDPALDRVATCLYEAGPDIARVAELEALRIRVHEAESQGLRRSRILDLLPDPILLTDVDDRVLLSNARAERLLTARPDASAGHRRAVETNNLYFSALRARATLYEDAENRHELRELRLVDPKNGSDLRFEASWHAFSGAGNWSEGTIWILRDITDLKNVAVELESQYKRAVATEHEARSESERLEVIIENAGVPILVTDARARIALMNREAEGLFDSPDGERPDDSDPDTGARMNDIRLLGLIQDFALQPQRVLHEQLRLIGSDGEPFPVEAVCTKILDADDEPVAVVTVLHDLTHEVEIERLAAELRILNDELEERVAGATRQLEERNEQLERQRSELERASRLKSEFLATMSHELRTPINAALGYNSLLREGLFGPLTDHQRRALERMQLSSEHLLAIINDILDLTKVESGGIVLHPTEVQPAEILERVSARARPAARKKSLVYDSVAEPDLPPLQVDELRLEQVLANLVSNAIKFTDEGTVSLRARRVPHRDWISFEVEDTGIGIAPSQLESIFEEFRQVDQTITREHGGTGLGLAISRKLTDLMGGHIDVESEPGEGALFRVLLPLVPPEPDAQGG